MKFDRLKKWMVLIPMILLTAGLMVMPGCNSSSGDDDDGDGGGSAPSGSSSFTADNTSPPANSIYLQLDHQDNNTLILAVKAKDVSNVYGVAFNLDFNPAVFRFASAAEDSFMRDGAATFFFATGKTGTVVVGVTRQADAPGKSGSGTICKLTFTGIAEGNSRFDFSHNTLYDPQGNPIGGVNWYGGAATVVF